MELSRHTQLGAASPTLTTASCLKLMAGMHRVKSAVRHEFRAGAGRNGRLLQLALNEAEALAWETDFPLLVFPTLAREKAEEAVAWNERQQALLRSRPLLEAA